MGSIRGRGEVPTDKQEDWRGKERKKRCLVSHAPCVQQVRLPWGRGGYTQKVKHSKQEVERRPRHSSEPRCSTPGLKPEAL